MDKIPVTVPTGYLGGDHGRKHAVIINEFGEAGIDNEIVVGADEEIFEMNNGCICCTVRGDLVRIVGGLMKRAGRLDGIIVESTGLADPAPVAQTFFVDDEVRAKTRLDAILDRGAFDLGRILDLEPGFLDSGLDHEHDSAIASACAAVDGPVDAGRFQAWIGGILARGGASILRAKGILAVSGAESRYVFQAVHMLADSAWGTRWRADEPRRSKIVFIGRGLRTAELASGFAACAAR